MAEEIDVSDIVKQLKEVNSPRKSQEDLSKQVPLLLKLGEWYLQKAKTSDTKIATDFIKANGLYNAALVISRKVNHEKVNHEIGENEILQGIIETYREFLRAFAIVKEVSVNEIRDEIHRHKELIKDERQVIKDSLEKMGSPLIKEDSKEDYTEVHAEKMYEIFQGIQNMYITLVSRLAEKCESRLGKPPCDYAIIALGSVARIEATPFSDLEFVILYSDPAIGDKINYFRVLTHFLNLKVINLGETILPALAIEQLNDFHSPDPNGDWFYDSETPRGISFDGAMPWACKTALGRMATKNKLALELIKTPEEMARLQDEESAVKEGYHLADILSRASLLYGKQALLDEYNERVTKKLNEKSPNVRVQLIGIPQYIAMLQQQDKEIVVKADVMATPGETAEKLNTKSSTTEEKSTRTVGFMRGIQQMILDVRTYDPYDSYLGLQCTVGALFDAKKQIYRLISLLLSDLGMIFNIRSPSPWHVISALLTQGIIDESDSVNIKICLSIANEIRLRTYFDNGGQKELLSPVPILSGCDEETLVGLLSTSHYMFKRCEEFFMKYINEEGEIDRSIFQKTYDPLSKAMVIGSCYFRLQNLPKALEWMKKVPKGSKDFGASLNGQGVIHCEQNEYDKAVKYFEDALVNSQHSICGSLTSLLNLATAMSASGDNKTAKIKIEAAIKKHDEIFRTETILRSALMLLLGHIHHNLGDVKSAIETFRKVQKMQERLNVNGTNVIQLCISIAKCCSESDQYEQSVKYIKQALKRCDKIFGENSRSSLLARFYGEAGDVYQRCHLFKEALPYYQRSLELYQLVFKNNTSSEIINCLKRLGVLLCETGDASGAMEHFESALEKAITLYGKAHYTVVEILNVLGQAQKRAGKAKEAHRSFEEANKLVDQIAGAPNRVYSLTSDIFGNLGKSYYDRGDLNQAKEYETKAVDMERKVNPRNTQRLVAFLTGLGHICYGREENDEALKHFKEAKEIVSKEAGNTNRALLFEAQFEIFHTYLNMKCAAECKTSFLEAKEIANSLPKDFRNALPVGVREKINFVRRGYKPKKKVVS